LVPMVYCNPATGELKDNVAMYGVLYSTHLVPGRMSWCVASNRYLINLEGRIPNDISPKSR
jgi:hypothetical protein